MEFVSAACALAQAKGPAQHMGSHAGRHGQVSTA